jgi:hypothetical protein
MKVLVFILTIFVFLNYRILSLLRPMAEIDGFQKFLLRNIAKETTILIYTVGIVLLYLVSNIYVPIGALILLYIYGLILQKKSKR